MLTPVSQLGSKSGFRWHLGLNIGCCCCCHVHGSAQDYLPLLQIYSLNYPTLCCILGPWKESRGLRRTPCNCNHNYSRHPEFKSGSTPQPAITRQSPPIQTDEAEKPYKFFFLSFSLQKATLERQLAGEEERDLTGSFPVSSTKQALSAHLITVFEITSFPSQLMNW